MTDQLQRIAAHIALLPTPEQWAELRARIEALEATQHAHADLSRLSDAEREQVTQELAKPVRVFTAKEVAPIVAPATRARFISEVFQAASAEVRPAAGLVERIEAVAGGDARVAIREVAAWLDTKGQHGCSLWLREEANHG